MTRDEKKRWLARYREGRRQLEKLAERRARAEAFGARVTVGFGAEPRGGKTDRVQMAVERMAQVDEEMAELRRRLPGWEREAEAELAGIPDAEYRRVMRYYYVECLTWAEVAALAGYSLRYVQKLNDRMVDEILERGHHRAP